MGGLLGTQPVASGWFAGLSTLAMVAAIDDTNGGLYMTLMQRYGSVEEAASYSMMELESGPFFMMVHSVWLDFRPSPGRRLPGRFSRYVWECC